VTARHALAADLPALATALADAFDQDPLMMFLFPDPPRRAVTLAPFFAISLQAGLHRGHTYTTSGLPGAAIWAPPDVDSLDRADGKALRAIVSEQHGDEGVARLRAFATAADEHHPRSTPHFYLFIAGIASATQGRGLGAELLAPVLAICDRDGTPAYLESSNARNVGFYERLGFVVTSEIAIEGGPVARGMWRAPRGSDN
jgi:ribosomal protein S18 acetylase RimI-like enzyme